MILFPAIDLKEGKCVRLIRGDMNKSTYTLLNVQFPIEQSKAEMFLFKLDLKGIACSKGSACQSGSDVGSHVLNEVLSSEELNKVSIRFSFSIYKDFPSKDILRTNFS